MTYPNKTKRYSVPIAWILILSILLNLFMVGTILGVLPGMKHRGFGPMALAAPHGEYMVDWMLRYLDARDADAFQAVFKAHVDDLKQAHSRLHDAMGEVATVFQSDRPDPAALQSALDRLNQARNDAGLPVDQIIQDAYIKLSPDGRHRLADIAQNPH